MTLQLPGLPVEEQMVDNWGQPTPFMQLRWQEMTEKLALQEASQDDTIGQLAGVVADLADQGAILAGQATTLGAAVTNIAAVTSSLNILSLQFADQNAAMALIMVQVFTKVNQLIDWVAWLDANGPVHYGGVRPSHLA